MADAIGYSVGYREKNISVVIKMKIAPDALGVLKRYWANEYVFLQDVPADKLSDVMVFMEVEGKGNWYKACLDDQGLILKSVSSQIFKTEELIGHYFDVPIMWRGDDW